MERVPVTDLRPGDVIEYGQLGRTRTIEYVVIRNYPSGNPASTFVGFTNMRGDTYAPTAHVNRVTK